MSLSVAFVIVDVLSVTTVVKIGGLNPFWKFAFVFKCFTDTIFLDDFKTVLDKLWEHKMGPNALEVTDVDMGKSTISQHIEDSTV